jgi:hypothetical protein
MISANKSTHQHFVFHGLQAHFMQEKLLSKQIAKQPFSEYYN